jgi:hypothetical protein
MAAREELADGGRLGLPRFWSATTVKAGTGAKEPKEKQPSTKSAARGPENAVVERREACALRKGRAVSARTRP